jgi:hypothetical protein
VADRREAGDLTSGDELLVRCAWCERIKVDEVWVVAARVPAMALTRETVGKHSHGICPDCLASLTPAEPL